MNKDTEALLSLNNKVYDEIEIVSSLLRLSKDFCINQESNANYYGLSQDESIKISAERNDFINIINILIERIFIMRNLNNDIESKILLHQNSNNCS